MKKLIFLSLLLTLFFFLGSKVYSQTLPNAHRPSFANTTGVNNGNALGKDPGTFTATGSGKSSGGRPDFVIQKLQGLKLQVCQRLSQNITKRSQKLVERANDMEKIFTRHALAVENYYTTKLVPSGKTLPNYDALVADIQTNKLAVDNLLTGISTESGSFSCQSATPSGQLKQFGQDMRLIINALNAFKKSVVNLIVAVAKLGGVGAGSLNASGSANFKNLQPTVVPVTGTTQSGGTK